MSRSLRRQPYENRMLTKLGSDLRFMRISRGWTQYQLADKAGLDQSHITAIERGLRNPRFRLLLKLARAFAVPIGTLCGGMDNGSMKREWHAPHRRRKTSVKRRKNR